MRKKLLMWATVVVLVMFAGNAIAEEEQKGPKILIEEKAASAKLIFIDKDAKETKIIELNLPGNLEIKEIRKSHPKLKSTELIREIRGRKAVVSNSGRNAALIEMLSEMLVPETEKEKKAIGDTDADYLQATTEIAYLDVNGTILWKKRTPKNMEILDAKISDEGERVAYIQSYVMGGADKGEFYEKLIVLNKSGEEVFKYPEKQEKYKLNNNVYISSKGRYVGVIGQTEHRKEITLFFDLQNKTLWVAERSYVISSISDKGIAQISYPNPNIKDTDSYENKIKEGIITEKINLKSYLGE